ncbi:PREDICTED: glutathione S-transferase T3-like [Camelina sativa]|uniref:Glutathione S-transferase T3-like n=1 Tax=Camelina sativa TaxID=90675 RepID=A0ABM0VIX4_CAMSA|nr:PREDICTED: glutathione S-transferase T3-like [Camelina sativa]
MNPFSHPPGFMDLLNSQGETHTNPYDIDSPNIELGESQVPAFSTQYSDAQHEDRRSRNKWAPADDILLISAWLNTSKDPIVSNEQKRASFWKRIADYFNENLKDARQRREVSHCKQRWGKINDIVCKFVGCYEAATKEKSSGQNENDVMKLANDIYYNDYNLKFTLEHAWRELRHDQKWCSPSTTNRTGTAKRRKVGDGSGQSSNSEPMTRPPGVKSCKGKSKKNVNETFPVVEDGKYLSELEAIYELKEKDFALREKISNRNMLEMILAKTEPLSDIDIALKNKLINDLLS